MDQEVRGTFTFLGIKRNFTPLSKGNWAANVSLYKQEVPLCVFSRKLDNHFFWGVVFLKRRPHSPLFRSTHT